MSRGPEAPPYRFITTKRAGKCASCGDPIPVGVRALYVPPDEEADLAGEIYCTENPCAAAAQDDFDRGRR